MVGALIINMKNIMKKSAKFLFKIIGCAITNITLAIYDFVKYKLKGL
jgi:hypothetical protein